MTRNKTTLGQPGASPKKVLKALDTLIEARDCLDCVAAAASGALKHDLDGSPILTVVNVAIDKVHRAVEILRGDDEIEEDAA